MRKHSPGRSLEGGIGHFALTLPLTGKGSGSLLLDRGPDLIPHLNKPLLETLSLLITAASRCLASSSGAVWNWSLQSQQKELGCCQKEGQEKSPRSVALSITSTGKVFLEGSGGGGIACRGELGV